MADIWVGPGKSPHGSPGVAVGVTVGTAGEELPIGLLKTVPVGLRGTNGVGVSVKSARRTELDGSLPADTLNRPVPLQDDTVKDIKSRITPIWIFFSMLSRKFLHSSRSHLYHATHRKGSILRHINPSTSSTIYLPDHKYCCNSCAIIEVGFPNSFQQNYNFRMKTRPNS